MFALFICEALGKGEHLPRRRTKYDSLSVEISTRQSRWVGKEAMKADNTAVLVVTLQLLHLQRR